MNEKISGRSPSRRGSHISPRCSAQLGCNPVEAACMFPRRPRAGIRACPITRHVSTAGDPPFFCLWRFGCGDTAILHAAFRGRIRCGQLSRKAPPSCGVALGWKNSRGQSDCCCASLTMPVSIHLEWPVARPTRLPGLKSTAVSTSTGSLLTAFGEFILA